MGRRPTLVSGLSTKTAVRASPQMVWRWSGSAKAAVQPLSSLTLLGAFGQSDLEAGPTAVLGNLESISRMKHESWLIPFHKL